MFNRVPAGPHPAKIREYFMILSSPCLKKSHLGKKLFVLRPSLLGTQLADRPVKRTGQHKKQADDDDREFDPGEVVGEGYIPL